MMNLGHIAVLPRVPEAIGRLEELAYNMWWSWETEAQALFQRLDPELWPAANHNPVKLLHRVAQANLDAAAEDADFLAAYQSVIASFDAYLDPNTDTWFKQHHPGEEDNIIAYFSAEFGLHEALPIYSGGLGVLSGDHCKAASDLGLPFIGVGFLYPQGYFTQHIDAEGRQQAEYEKINLAEVPARPALDADGNEVLVNVDLPGRTVYAKIWRIQVGRVPIYLMDTDVPRNAPQDRELSARLYGGDREMRISQEVVLGIGGVRAILALGYNPAVWHMNEGHSAFLGLERVRRKVQDHGLSFDEAVEAVRSNTLFTTHTPVPAGNDSFAFELVDKFFWQYWGQLGIDRDRFIEFARQELPWGPQYSMTVLALRLSAFANGVSKLHGEVSREMWQFLWPEGIVDEVPIGSITNGIHDKTWLAHELKTLYSRYLAEDWREHVEEPATWDAVNAIPDDELWSVHEERKAKLFALVRDRVARQLTRHGESPRAIAKAEGLLNPRALTLGFARRFATYKRATLLFRDQERLMRLLNDPERPIQIIFSGKAHPADEAGKELIQQVYRMSRQPELLGKIVFVEDYDMNIARHLIAGVDVWVNTPRRPHEASGTSGQKAALNGVPSFSILDGWWDEGYDGTNGWAIGDGHVYKDQETQDEADAYSLYSILENAIIPLFFERDPATGVPAGWVQLMKNTIRTCAPEFSMRRMVIDYTQNYYLPSAVNGRNYHGERFALAKQMTAWKRHLRELWTHVRVERGPVPLTPVSVGQPVNITARVWLHGIAAEDVTVEAVFGRANGLQLRQPSALPMQQTGVEGEAVLFETEFVPSTSGPFVVGVRVRPHNTGLLHQMDAGLVRWA